MPKAARARRKPGADPEPLTFAELDAIAAYCGYVLVTSRHHTALVDIRTGKTCMRGCDAVIGHLRELRDAKPSAAEVAAGYPG